jgi:hypothetical protein
MTSRSQLEKIQLSNLLSGNAGNVAEGTNQATIVVVDDNRALLLLVTTIATLSFAGTLTLGSIYLKRKES